MGIFENRTVGFVYATAIAIALVVCFDNDGRPSNNDNNGLTGITGRYRRKQRPRLHFVYTIVTSNFRFYNTMLDLHQDHRIVHSANYLFWRDELYTKAMNCLNEIIAGRTTDARDEDDERCYTYVSEDVERATATAIFDFWYGEGADYDYTNEPNDRNAEHFTQIVWKSSTTVGFAFKYENNTNYFAAVYSPEGNVAGQYFQNVGRPTTENVR